MDEHRINRRMFNSPDKTKNYLCQFAKHQVAISGAATAKFIKVKMPSAKQRHKVGLFMRTGIGGNKNCNLLQKYVCTGWQ